MNPRRQYVIEEFPIVDLGDIRRAVGGRRKLRKVTSVTVDLPGGRSVPVSLVRAPANIAGNIVYALCRRCGHRARTLRIVPTHDALVCAGCVKALYGAKYESQITMRANPRSSIASNEVEPLDAGRSNS
jgi:hypothetical protein